MTEEKKEYPVTGLHTFLEEASQEFRRFRFQAKVNLVGSIILLLLLSRFLIFAFGHYGPTPFHREPPFTSQERPEPFIPDFILLIAGLAAVSWSLYAYLRQRTFVSRWGERFEKLTTLEKKYLPDEPS